jgi:predicted dehydrogenase
MSSQRIAVIGAGYMGSQHARVISASPRADVGVIIDVDGERAEKAARPYGARYSTDIAAAHQCDAAIVATATDAHVASALSLIEAGIPLLVEKPIATELEDIELLVKAAEDLEVPLACGFVERFNPVVTTALDILEDPPIHMVAIRHSPTAPRINNSVVHDLLIHDVDLALRFMDGQAVARSSGASWTPAGNQFPEIADCTLQFDSGTIATLSASRAGQRKLRSIHVNTASMLLELDLLRLDLTVYRNVRQEQVDSTYRAETIVDIPFVRHQGEPLSLQLEHFLGLVNGELDPAPERLGILASHRTAVEVERNCVGVPRPGPHETP